MGDMSSLNYTRVCRICLTKRDNCVMQNIFQSNIIMKLTECTSLEVCTKFDNILNTYLSTISVDRTRSSFS